MDATWLMGRWLCPKTALAAEATLCGRDGDCGRGDEAATAGGSSSCGFEHRPPPVPWTPLCSCGQRACWEPLAERFLCPLPRSRGGCGFEAPAQLETADVAERLDVTQMVRQAAVNTAALLTATAYGLGAHCFVSQCDVPCDTHGCGLGLFARGPLQRGQAIVEYTGPRLPMSKLVHGSYALEVPDGSQFFIDGNFENVGGDAFWHGERSPAIFANHSRVPNCRLEHWPGRSSHHTVHTLWLVATEPIAAGTELRFDYEEGGSNYWQGFPPRESEWRTERIPAPPPSGVEPTVDYLPALLAGWNPPWPHGGRRRPYG